MRKWDKNIDVPDIIDFYVPNSQSRFKYPVDDNIYTLDIEVSSLFYIDGEFKSFDYSKGPDFYKDVTKVSVPYIWMFGVNDTVYYGREFYELEDVFKEIYDEHFYKICYIFNLSYEMQFLMNIFADKYTIENMVCRDLRKPIQFEVPELHLIFRCAYMLTNMSLETASLQYTDVEKRKGDLDYNLARNPHTKLSEIELGYCKFDIICLYKVVLYFRNRFKHLYKVPLTATSITRKELKKHIDYFYIKKQWDLVPPPDIYLKLMSCFAGGYTHANALKAYKIYPNVHSQDIASSYPSVMVTEKFPCKEFLKCSPNDFNDSKREYYAFMMYIKFKNVKPKFYNHYMQISKCVNAKNIVNDNGRVVSASYVEMWLTDVDFDIMKEFYKFKYEIVECYKAKKDFLDEKIIKFILDLYKDKTTLKKKAKTDEQTAEIYQMKKACLNSLYGVSVQNVLSASSDFVNGKWVQSDLTKSFIVDKLEKSKKSWSTLFFYAVGVWVTSISRKNLVMNIAKIDSDMLYSDTDSIKYVGEHQDIFDEYNNNLIEKYKEVCKKYPDLTLDDFMPIDEDGITRPIGFYEYEQTYDFFASAGAKKYCYQDKDGLHITISGVNKKTGVSALNGDIKNFLNDELIFNYEQSGRLIHFYIDNQPTFTFKDYNGVPYTSNYKYGIVLQPTTYTLGGSKATAIYLELVKQYERRLAIENGKQENSLCKTK